MVTKKVWAACTLSMVLALQVGCGAANQTPTENISEGQEEVVTHEDNQQANEEKVMREFNSLISSNPALGEVITFIDDNIANVSEENVSVMVFSLEDQMKNSLPTFEEKFTSSEDTQVEIREIFKDGIDESKIEDITDTEIKTLLEEAINSGFKIETAEGYYFPILDYEFLKPYSLKATREIKDYIAIMAVESNQVPVKDAALIIDWNEIVKRALKQEQFLKQYGDGERFADVNDLYNRYLVYALFGSNNTPLFAYETNAIVPEAKDVYLKAVETNENSDFIKMLKGFLDVVENNNGKLTDEVDAYRKEITDFPS